MPTVSGTFDYHKSLPTQYGCDSLVTLYLTVHDTFDIVIYDTICLNESYHLYNFDVIPTVSGDFEYHKQESSQYGCDSLVTLYLTVHDTFDIVIYDTICLNESYNQNNFIITPTASGTFDYHKNLLSKYGCDSLVVLYLTVNQVYYDTVAATICLGEQYKEYHFNITPTQAGLMQYSQHLQTVLGCDSILTLNLLVLPSYNDTIRASICLGEYYNDGEFDIAPSQSGFLTYTHSYVTSNNCDSIITLELTVNPVYYEYISASIYEDEYYKIGNYQYNTPGLHISNLLTQDGCDSIINLTLDVIYYPSETAFSPFNKDGVNDYFMPGFKVQIFNRYGQLIYETKTAEEQYRGWDGRNSRGHDVEPGMYFYILYNSSGKPRLKSSVEVLKK
jgi:hypothetical protein